jgi:FkbM family methyltransferase
MLKIKEKARPFINKMGFDLCRLSPETNPFLQIKTGLEKFNVDLVFDIGANVGQFASKLRSIGYNGRIVSFEPLREAHEQLQKKSYNDSKWIVHSPIAIGDFDGEIEINVSGNSVSSSVLPMLDAHSTAAAESAYVSKEKVSIKQFDSIACDYIPKGVNFFVKIDTQGFEWQVLDGAKLTLKSAKGILCELSLVPLYKGGRLWRDIIDRLQSEGFTLWAIQPGFTNPADGRTLQIDAIFFRID